MWFTQLPIPEFLRIVLAAAQTGLPDDESERSGQLSAHGDPAQASNFEGIAVVLDRIAEQRSTLLEKITGDVHSFHDVTGKEILIIVPWPERTPDQQGAGTDKEIPFFNNPYIEEALGAPGLYFGRYRLSEAVKNYPKGLAKNVYHTTLRRYGAPDQSEMCTQTLLQDRLDEGQTLTGPGKFENDDEEKKALKELITESATSVRIFFGLSEKDDVPSLILLCLRDRNIYVFHYAEFDDAYDFFKEIIGKKQGNNDATLTGK
jgi:hypothetical protein